MTTPIQPAWCLPSKLDDNPLVWMLSVNGLIVDVRYVPREVQEEALGSLILARLHRRLRQGCLASFAIRQRF